MFHSTRTRVVAAVATLALATGTFLVVAPAAQAALTVHPVGSIDHTTGARSVFSGVANQPAGDWVTDPMPAVSEFTSTDADSMIIQLDDIVPAVPAVLVPPTPAVPAHCKTAAAAVQFGASPDLAVTNLTVTGPGSEAEFSAQITSSGTTGATGTCNKAGIKDLLIITATADSGPGAVLQISGIQYTVGSAVVDGPVPYRACTAITNQTCTAPASFTTAEANAVVSGVRSASANPVILVPTGSDATKIGDLVIQEQHAGAITGGVCVTLVDPPGGTLFTAPAPGVTTTGGANASAHGPVTISEDGLSLSFSVTPATTPAATTFTLRGIYLETTDNTGPVNAEVTQGVCPVPEEITAAAAGDLLTPDVRLAYVGDVSRVFGANRYATAAAIAHDMGSLVGKTVVIARGDNFPDALAASYLAGQNDVPILLTTPTSVPSETVEALAFGGVTDVVLVGGTAAISNAVQTYLTNFHTYAPGSSALTDDPTEETLTVTRIGGADRYATAAMVAEDPGLDQAGTIGIADGDTCDNDLTQAIVASGENFPDALAAGGLAYGGVGDDGCGGGSIPLLLTPKASLSPATALAIRDLGIQHVILMGGTGAVSDGVESALDSLAGVTVTRIAGDTRQDTAVQLATLILGPDTIGAWNSGTFLVARPDTFPDALAASALSGSAFAPLYLANSPTELGADNVTAIVDYPQDYGTGILIGGTSALSGAVFTQTAAAIASQP
jgi:putative cell wall-binding protein